MSAAGWYPDPHGEHQYRYWDGEAWTQQVHDGQAAAAAPAAATASARITAGPARAAGPATAQPDERSGSHAGIAWVIAVVLVLATFGLTYVIASALQDDDSSHAPERPVATSCAAGCES